MEDDSLGPDRRGGLERGAHRRDGLVVDHGVGRREVDEVERVADDALDPGLLAPLRKRAIASGVWFVGRHIRGLWVKT